MGAIISACELYRYRLERELSDVIWPPKVVAFIMVNPSTADASLDDPTIRKVRGFATRMGGTRLIVGNLFAWRAKDVKALCTASDPVGPENDEHLRLILGMADTVVVAWGALAKLPKPLRSRWADFAEMARWSSEKPLMCLGTAKDGHPLHPCMIGYDRPLIEWRRP